MKKMFTLAAAMVAALSVNAQEVCQIDAEGAGLTSTATTVAAGTVVGKSDNITISVLNEDKVKSTSCKMKNNGFVIGGAEVSAQGITGSTNPVNASGNPALYPADGIPTTGFALKIDAGDKIPETGGYVYVCGKLSSNKNYYVFEDGRMIGYDLVMWCDEATQFQPLKITVENDSEEDGIAYRAATVAWPEVIFTGDENSAVKKNGEGVIKFPVYPGVSYVVGAGGSKISACAVVYSENPNLQIEIPESEWETKDKDGNVTDSGTEVNHILVAGDVTGINKVAVDKAIDADAPAYNVAGQRVSKDAKGLIIVNGKKYVNK